MSEMTRRIIATNDIAIVIESNNNTVKALAVVGQVDDHFSKFGQ